MHTSLYEGRITQWGFLKVPVRGTILFIAHVRILYCILGKVQTVQLKKLSLAIRSVYARNV